LGTLLSAGSFPRALAFQFDHPQIKSRKMVDMGTPESKTEAKDPLNQSLKYECEKSEESMEMLKFFDRLSESQRHKVPENLCKYKENEHEKPKNLNKTYSAMENQSNKEKAHLYGKFMETQRKMAVAKKYGGKIPSHQLQSGLQITLVSSKDKDLGEVEVLLREVRRHQYGGGSSAMAAAVRRWRQRVGNGIVVAAAWQQRW
jgi:hypothetical protein